MKMYTCNGGYFRTQEEAKAASKTTGNPFEQVEVPTDAKGLVAYLNSVAGRRFTEAAEGPETPFPTDDSMPATVQLDDAFLAAPLGQQLTLATIALENARSKIGKENAPKPAPQGYGGKVERVPEVADDLL